MTSPPVNFAAIFDGSPNPAMVVDRELRFVAANRAYLRVTGSRLEDLLGHPLFERFPNDPADPNNASVLRLRASFEKVLATGKPDDIALIHYRVAMTPGGPLESRYWSAHHAPLCDEQGRVTHVMQLTSDVTQVADVPIASVAAALVRGGRAQEQLTDVTAQLRDLQQVFEQAPALIAYLRGPDHVFELANAAYLETVGRRALIGLPLREALPEIADQGFAELLDNVRATGKPYVGHGARVALRRGPNRELEERVVDFVYQPVTDARGTVVGIFVQGVDITDRTRAESERERLVAIVGQSSDFVGFADLEGKIGYLNPAGRELLGVPGDAGGTTLVDFFSPEDRPVVEREILPTVLRDGRSSGELHFRHFATGERIPVSYNLFALVDDSGKPNGIATVSRDLRAEKRAGRERDDMLAEHRFLAESIPQQVWSAQPDGSLDFVNGRVIEYFGSTREAILGAGWQEFIHPDDRAPCLETWTQSLQTGAPYHIEFRLRGADGVYRWYLGRATARRDASGAIRHWFGTNTDIDEAKRIQDTLRARVEYESQLIGIVSHDLRNPLSTIEMAAQLLQKVELPEPAAKMVGPMLAAARRGNRLIAELLDFAQARTFGIPIHPAPTNLPALVREVVAELQLGEDGAKRLSIVHEGSEDGHWDGDRLAQVVANLVGNALQHAPSQASIRVRTAIADARATIEVHNDGEPIPESERATLFEPFARGRTASSKKRSRSVGLGLYIARMIVVAHHGVIEVESSEAAGTCFRVILPSHAERGKPS